jgi:hypothetical protein
MFRYNVEELLVQARWMKIKPRMYYHTVQGMYVYVRKTRVTRERVGSDIKRSENATLLYLVWSY